MTYTWSENKYLMYVPGETKAPYVCYIRLNLIGRTVRRGDDRLENFSLLILVRIKHRIINNFKIFTYLQLQNLFVLSST